MTLRQGQQGSVSFAGMGGTETLMFHWKQWVPLGRYTVRIMQESHNGPFVLRNESSERDRNLPRRFIDAAFSDVVLFR